MIVYAESSAVLAWLFRERHGTDVEKIFQTSGSIIASDLTLIECDRALHRAKALGRLDRAAALAISNKYNGAASGWVVLRLVPAVVQRARAEFPGERIRNLDALHVAWALYARSEHPELALLTLDQRIREVAGALGLDTMPN